MNVVAVMGSPHKSGNVATLMAEVIRGAKDAGHSVTRYDINEMNVRGCQGCRTCKNDNTDCIVDDDLKTYWPELHNDGALIVGAPNYASTICGPMITYLDRHYCLLDIEWKSRLPYGIKLVGVFSQGREDKDAYLDAYNWFLGDFQNRDMVRHGMIIHAGRIAAKEQPDLMRQAYELGNSL